MIKFLHSHKVIQSITSGIPSKKADDSTKGFREVQTSQKISNATSAGKKSENNKVIADCRASLSSPFFVPLRVCDCFMLMGMLVAQKTITECCPHRQSIVVIFASHQIYGKAVLSLCGLFNAQVHYRIFYFFYYSFYFCFSTLILWVTSTPEL